MYTGRLRAVLRRSALSGALASALVLASATSSSARQAPGASGGSPLPPRAVVPFAAGERADYQVKLGGFSVGSGSLEVLGIESVNGGETYHTRMQISGGIPFARVDDKFDSWIDVRGLFSRRFKQDQKEVRFRRNRTYDFFPQSRTFRRENGETGTIPTDRPLDDVSFLFFARTLPLRVGDVYTLPRYFKEDGNPVVLRVLRKETVTVPAGTFETVVVQPIIKTDGLFGEGGRAEVFFTDDARRVLVQMTSRVPVLGSLSLHLRSYDAGSGPVAGGTRDR